MTSPSTRRVAVLAALLPLASGCSWVFVKGPPGTVAVPDHPVECTTSRTAPVLDAICAGYFVVNGIVWASSETCSSSYSPDCVSSDDRTTGMLVSAGLAVACGLSAASGFGKTSRCAEAKGLNALCIRGDEASCKRLSPNWTPAMRLPGAPAPFAPRAVPPPGLPPAFPPPPTAVQPAVPAPATPAEPQSAEPGQAAPGGCAKDVDCKGDRICERGVCVDPPSKQRP